MSDQLKQATQKAEQGVQDGGQKWDAMSDEQKQKAFDALPDEQKHNKTYLEWIKDGYHRQYENWMPWIEDQYLKWFTKDNKASHTAKSMCCPLRFGSRENPRCLFQSVRAQTMADVGCVRHP